MDSRYYQRREGKEHASELSSPEKDQRRFYDPHNPYGYEIAKNNPDSGYNTVKRGVGEWREQERRREIGDDLHLGSSQEQSESTRIIENRQLGTIMREVRKYIGTIYTVNDVNTVGDEHEQNMKLIRQGDFANLTRKMTEWGQSQNSAMRAYAEDFFRISHQAEN